METKLQPSFIKIGNTVFPLDSNEGFEKAREAMNTYGIPSLPVCFGSHEHPYPSKSITLYADPDLYAGLEM